MNPLNPLTWRLRVNAGENTIHALRGFLIAPLEQVSVGVHCELNRGVLEPLGDLLSMNPLGNEQRGMCVTQIVEADSWKLLLFENDPEAVKRIATVERGSHRAR
jgi:hypothetical protein